MKDPAIKMSVVRSDPSHVEFLNSLNHCESRVVSFRVRPDYNAHFGIIAYDIMAAMGARDDVLGPDRNSAHNPLHLPVWLAANEIEDVVVCGAESLSAAVLHSLAETAFLTRSTFWFVFDHELPERLLEAMSDWCPEPVSQEAFDSHWESRVHGRGLPGTQSRIEEWPRHLPHEDFPLFLAEVRRQLPPPQAGVVEADFRATVKTTEEKINEMGAVTEEALVPMLREQLKAATHPAQALTRVRAFQVAAFRAGFLLKVDQAALLASELAEFNRRVEDPEAWRLLRAYRQPYRGAANACLAAGIDIEDAPAIKVGEVAGDGSTVGVAGRTMEVPPGAHVFIRALRLQRLADGAGSDEPLFFDYSRGPQQAFLLVRALNATARELGVGLVTSRLKRHGGKARNWQTKHGIALEQLVASPGAPDAER